MAVPSHVRQAMLSRTLNHDDMLARLTLPTLIVHGLEDRVVLPAMSERYIGLIPHAKLAFYDHVGHAAFSESAAAFNAELQRVRIVALTRPPAQRATTPGRGSGGSLASPTVLAPEAGTAAPTPRARRPLLEGWCAGLVGARGGS